MRGEDPQHKTEPRVGLGGEPAERSGEQAYHRGGWSREEEQEWNEGSSEQEGGGTGIQQELNRNEKEW